MDGHRRTRTFSIILGDLREAPIGSVAILVEAPSRRFPFEPKYHERGWKPRLQGGKTFIAPGI